MHRVQEIEGGVYCGVAHVHSQAVRSRSGGGGIWSAGDAGSMVSSDELGRLRSSATAAGASIATSSTGAEVTTSPIVSEAAATLPTASTFERTATAPVGTVRRATSVGKLASRSDAALLDIDSISADLVRICSYGSLESIWGVEIDESAVLSYVLA